MLTAAFGFAHAGHNLIIFELYNNWSVEADKNILESAMSNSGKLIKSSHLQKLSNQSTFYVTLVTEMTKTFTVIFYLEIALLFVIERNVSIEKSRRWWKYTLLIYFTKLLLTDRS